ncbi:MAG TPA: hypothetical protein PLS10_09240 [Chitinophagales bacterium]|nr:hypothetical protein [Chitinophagales bacterium]
MVSIVGNIKINDAIRLKYLECTLKSYAFLKDFKLILNIDTDCKTLDKITELVKKIGFKNFELSNESGNYGEVYCRLLEQTKSHWIINLIEDHFCLLNNELAFLTLLNEASSNNVDVIKSSFWQIEKNSSKEIFGHYDTNYGLVFDNNKTNHNLYQKYYGSRYYIGVNFITTLEFAKRFWSREFETQRPHEFEISKFDSNFNHICMIPNIEIHASIEDNHGENKTCLLERNERKFWEIYNNIA